MLHTHLSSSFVVRNRNCETNIIEQSANMPLSLQWTTFWLNTKTREPHCLSLSSIFCCSSLWRRLFSELCTRRPSIPHTLHLGLGQQELNAERNEETMILAEKNILQGILMHLKMIRTRPDSNYSIQKTSLAWKRMGNQDGALSAAYGS